MPTPAGQVQVDVLEVTDAELANLPDDPTDRLHVLSHAWAAPTASPMIIRSTAMPDLTVAVAEPGPLITIKLQSIMNRGAFNEGTDLLDIIHLSLDIGTAAISRSQLEAAHPQLRQDATLHAKRWLEEHADRSLRLVRAAPEGRDTNPDDIRLVGELLHNSLAASPA